MHSHLMLQVILIALLEIRTFGLVLVEQAVFTNMSQATSLCYCLHGTAVGALLLTVFKMLLCKGQRCTTCCGPECLAWAWWMKMSSLREALYPFYPWCLQLFPTGRRSPGQLTGVWFPISAACSNWLFLGVRLGLLMEITRRDNQNHRW